MRIVVTVEGATPETGEPEESVPASVLLVTWVEDHISRLEGKEACDAYYGRLEG